MGGWKVIIRTGLDAAGFAAETENKRVFCYGAGDIADDFMYEYAEYGFDLQVVCYIDSSSAKWGETIDYKDRQFDICSPDALKSRLTEDDVILVTSTHFESICQGLAKLHLPDDMCVYSYRDIYLKTTIESGFSGREREPNRLVMFYTPTYSNLGDHAIAQAEKVFFKQELGKNIIEVTDKLYFLGFDEVKKQIKNDDILLVTGGGFLGNLWFENEKAVRDIIASFPDNRIVIMPQSIHYTDDEEGGREYENSVRIYNGHKNLIICAREKYSYDIMRKAYSDCKVILVPDIVLYMRPGLKQQDRRGILFCIRNDKESARTEEDKAALAGVEARFSDITHTNTLFERKILTQAESERLVKEKLYEFSRARLVITDRLHGMIFAAITGTPCIALDNSYHKVLGTYEWIRDCEYVKLAKSGKEADELIEPMLRKGGGIYEDNRSRYTPLIDSMRQEG